MEELTYTEVNGIRYPDLTLPDEPEVFPPAPTSKLVGDPGGKYALMRRKFLKNHRRGTFACLLMNGGRRYDMGISWATRG